MPKNKQRARLFLPLAPGFAKFVQTLDIINVGANNNQPILADSGPYSGYFI